MNPAIRPCHEIGEYVAQESRLGVLTSVVTI